MTRGVRNSPCPGATSARGRNVAHACNAKLQVTHSALNTIDTSLGAPRLFRLYRSVFITYNKLMQTHIDQRPSLYVFVNVALCLDTTTAAITEATIIAIREVTTPEQSMPADGE